MISEQNHEMRLETVHPSGAEEWLCPECGRRFIAEWEPNFRRVILEHGQDAVIHVGHGMGLSSMSVDPTQQHKPVEDSKLQDVWKRYLENLDFDSNEDDDPNQSAL